jgi:hypothetical protein
MRMAVVGVLAVVLSSVGAVPASAEWHDVCGDLARSIERAHRIPHGLVQAISLAESGRWLGGGRDSRAWPWTVTSGTDNFYLPTKQAAIAKVRELQARGRTNIDVGCMQVNLHYHGDQFASLEEAIDPARNVQYGASYLRSLREQTNSWGIATARYHSRNKGRGEAYRSKVYRLWNEVRKQTSQDRRLAPQQIALSAIERDAAPLDPALVAAGEPSPPERLKRPAGRAAAPGAIRIIRGD